MVKKILIRFGDLMLKGKNMNYFISIVRGHVKNALRNYKIEYEMTHDRIYITYQENDEKAIVDILKKIPGIYSISVIYLASQDLNDVIAVANKAMSEQDLSKIKTFKIETKRADKNFPLTSLEITQKIAPEILKNLDEKIMVSVKNPDKILHIEIRRDQSFVYFDQIHTMGGYPFGSAGKGLLMMSGGIDSPVAAYLAMKQGVEVELFHFESTPLTPLESVQKVIDLAKKLSVYTKNGKIKLHLVPFSEIHESLLVHVYDPYIITIMRRMMYRIAESYAKKNKQLAILNGESVGQVASQTMESMKVVEAVTTIPVLRPLITYDKLDIISLSKKIDTYDISIRPFNDCCSIYVPRNPVTKPKIHFAEKYEAELDFTLIDKAVDNVITLDIHNGFEFNISEYGFSVSEAYEMYKSERSDKN